MTDTPYVVIPNRCSASGLPMSASKSSKRAPKPPEAEKGRLTRISVPMLDATRAEGTCDVMVLMMASLCVPRSLCPLTRCLLTTVISYPAPSLDLRKMGLPQHLTWPLAMMAMRSPSRSASSRKCVVSRMVRPSRCVLSMSHVARRLYGSMPLVGSSRMTSLGSPSSAMATDSFRFWPPLSSRDCARSFSVRPTRLIASSISRLATSDGSSLISANSSRCSRTVSAGHSTLCCGHTPSDRRISPMCSSGCPYTVALPDVDGMRPLSMLNVVDLPAPLCPRITVI